MGVTISLPHPVHRYVIPWIFYFGVNCMNSGSSESTLHGFFSEYNPFSCMVFVLKIFRSFSVKNEVLCVGRNLHKVNYGPPILPVVAPATVVRESM